MRWLAMTFLLALALLLLGCIGIGSPANVTPTYTVVGNFTPSASPTPNVIINITLTPTPVPTPKCPTGCRYGCIPNTTICAQPQCPPTCELGCEPGTAVCRTLACPATCPFGCEPGTTTCRVLTQVLPMNNTDFERGDFAGWTVSGSGFKVRDGALANAQLLYFSEPYSGWQGTYFASSYPERSTTGAITSEPFTITKNFMDFLVVGQSDSQLCVALTIDDDNIYTDCDELRRSSSTVRMLEPSVPQVNPFSRFRRVTWDVSRYKGRNARIHVIDNSVRGWVEVDDFRQEDNATVPIITPVPREGYACNSNTLCEHGLGEFEYGCPTDCPSPSSCRFTAAERGLVDYALYCYSFKLSERGLQLYLTNTGLGVQNHTIRLEKFKCSMEESPDIETYENVSVDIPAGSFALVANGTAQCYGRNGERVFWDEGEIFSGHIFYQYVDTETNAIHTGRLNLDAVVWGA